MRICIGILAWNEADCIAGTIRLLSQQSLLNDGREGVEAVEIICVPNGCTDRTADIARQALDTHCSNRTVTWRVCELEPAGKPNAWNEFVHSFSDQSADVIILMDAGIDLTSRDTLKRLVGALIKHPIAHAVVGMPVKGAARTGRVSLAERLSGSVSRMTTAGPPELHGGLYCARGEILRQIWIPSQLLVDDGFIKAMIVTDFFTRPDRIERLVRVREAVYEFEPYLRPTRWFRHRRRLAVGQAVNMLLYAQLWALPEGQHAGEFVRRQEEANPNWLTALLQEHLQTTGWWALPSGLFLRRLWNKARKLRHFSAVGGLIRAPLAIGSIIFEIPVLIAANAELKKQRLTW